MTSSSLCLIRAEFVLIEALLHNVLIVLFRIGIFTIKLNFGECIDNALDRKIASKRFGVIVFSIN